MIYEQIRLIAPRGAEDWLRALVAELPRWEVTTVVRQAMLVGQYAVETNGFTEFTENLNYSEGNLTRVWPTHFPTLSAAQPYVRQAEKLANYIYDDANRVDGYHLGNIQPGDGWLFRGRGIVQLTGRAAYRVAGLAIQESLEQFPELLLRPEIGVKAGCWYWYSHGCNALSDREDIEGVTRAINGGLTELNARKQWYGQALAVLQK